jgi:hypothetical protein
MGDDDVAGLVIRLHSERLDVTAIYALEAHRPDPRIIPALASAFDNRKSKRDRQKIAGTLLRLGERSEKYFDFLAHYAQSAVDDRAPSFAKYDSNGRPIKGQFSAEFENWCAQNGKDRRSVAALQVSEYPEDILALGEAEDSRSIPILRQGLDSPYPMVVALSVQGLGRLRDIAAIPLIASVAERFPEKSRAIAIELPWYAWPEAEALRVRLVPDRKARDFDAADVEAVRSIERKRVLSRSGVRVEK